MSLQKPYPQNVHCPDLAKHVAKIEAECPGIDKEHAHYACGQQFDTGGLNVIVRRAVDKQAIKDCRKSTFDCKAASIWT
jgi:hypothetical protein